MGFHFLAFSPGRHPLSEVASRLQLPERIVRDAWEQKALKGEEEGGMVWFEAEAVNQWLRTFEVPASSRSDS